MRATEHDAGGGSKMRVAEAFSAAGINVSGESLDEACFRAKCQNCAAEHRLSEIGPRKNGQQTEYVCPACDAVFVVVGPAPGLTGGYRLKDNVVLPLGGMEVDVTSV